MRAVLPVAALAMTAVGRKRPFHGEFEASDFYPLAVNLSLRFGTRPYLSRRTHRAVMTRPTTPRLETIPVQMPTPAKPKRKARSAPSGRPRIQ